MLYLAIRVAGERHLPQTTSAHAAEALRSDRSSAVVDRKGKVVVFSDQYCLLGTSRATEVVKTLDSFVASSSLFLNGLLVNETVYEPESVVEIKGSGEHLISPEVEIVESLLRCNGTRDRRSENNSSQIGSIGSLRSTCDLQICETLDINSVLLQ